MAASSTCDTESVSNIALLTARCTGFAKVKGQNDYAFVLDLEWSDDRAMSIKRTYTQFQTFHQQLTKLFPELKQTIKSKLRLQTSLKENMTSLFAKNKQGLAESREQMLDLYLVNLLRQPERVRRSNVVLSFFEPKESDPKPCKPSSPNEKSDSGIDLTSDQRQTSSPPRPTMCDMAVQHEGDSLANTLAATDEDYLNKHCGVDSCVQPPQGWRDEYDSGSADEYDGDTSGTETDNDPFDEDYLLDVGFAELMLQSADDMELSRQSSDSSTWCSNLNKFSNILNTLPSVDSSSKQYTMTSSSLYNLSDEEYDELTSSICRAEGEPRENSDTESQMVAADHLSDGLESDDEFCCKPVAQTDMNHYYLSVGNETSAAGPILSNE